MGLAKGYYYTDAVNEVGKGLTLTLTGMNEVSIKLSLGSAGVSRVSKGLSLSRVGNGLSF